MVWINNIAGGTFTPLHNLDPYWNDGSYTEYPYSSETYIAGLKVFYDIGNDQDHTAITTADPNILISKVSYGLLITHKKNGPPFNIDGAKYYIKSTNTMIAGPGTVCYDGSSFQLIHTSAASTVTWTVSGPFTISPSSGSKT